MKEREKKKIHFFHKFVFLIFFAVLIIFSFLSENSQKGAFHTDEPGTVLGGTSSGRTIQQIFKDAAYQAQPPLDYLLREKIYTPLLHGFLNQGKYPEIFHRLLSLIWWLLPLGYIFLRFNEFSFKNKLILLLSLLFIISSDFFKFYLAETKHYSAIAASFTTMVIFLFFEKKTIAKRKWEFIAISSILPLLHIVSFSFYLFILIIFLIFLFKKTIFKKRHEKLWMLIIVLFYLSFVIFLYFLIRNQSLTWQHPSINNLKNISVIVSYIKWTLDWIFSGGLFYPLYKILPVFIKNNFLFIFASFSLLLIPKLYSNLLISKEKAFPINLVLGIIISFVWPLTIAVFLYNSGMFTGERYSIAILVAVFFLISSLIVNLGQKLIKRRILFYLFIVVLALSSLVFWYKGTLLDKKIVFQSDEAKFVKEEKNLLMDKNTYIIADNGAYSGSIPIYAILESIPIEAKYLQCRFGLFQENGKNSLNSWIDEHRKDPVYLFSQKYEFMKKEDVVWESGNRVLYKIKDKIENKYLCDNTNDFNGCYLTCFKNEPISEDGRSVPNLFPHLDIQKK